MISITESYDVTDISAVIRNLSFEVGPAAKREMIVSVDNLELRAGQFITLSGPSGSGKSTLLYLLSGLLLPSSGTVKWNDVELSGLSEIARDRWRREHAGFVFQNFHLIDELSPLNNVLVPVWFSSFSAKLLRKRAGDLLDRFGVPQDRRRINLLSRGEQQRVALARALIFDPAVIFADEPTASLDAESAQKVARTLAELAREDNRLVIAASHDENVHRLADRRFAITHGHINEQASA